MPIGSSGGNSDFRDRIAIWDICWTGYDADATGETVEIGTTGWASRCFDRDVEVPDGVTAYVATATDGTTVTLQPVTTGKIPALTGVLLRGTAGSAPMFTYTTDAPAIDDNLLTGVVARSQTSAVAERIQSTASPYCYVLGNGDDGFGFYLYTGNFVPAGRACLVSASTLSAPSMRVRMAETDRLAAVCRASDADIPTYDLTGRRVRRGVPAGLGVTHNRKLIVKP